MNVNVGKIGVCSCSFSVCEYLWFNNVLRVSDLARRCVQICGDMSCVDVKSVKSEETAHGCGASQLLKRVFLSRGGEIDVAFI